MTGYLFPPFPVSYLSPPFTFFVFTFSVPTQSVECSISSFLAYSGLLNLSFHSTCPRPNKGYKSSSPAAAALGVSGVIRLDCRTAFLPVYTRKRHRYPVLDSHSSKVFQNFSCHCYAPSITPESTAERSALTENLQGGIPTITEHMLIATPNERLNYSLPLYRRN